MLKAKNKAFLMLTVAAAIGEWEERKPNSLPPADKWNFDSNQVYECVILKTIRVPNGQNGPYTIYFTAQLGTKKRYVFFGTSILDERLDGLVGTAVRVSRMQKPAGKRYYNWSVATNKQMSTQDYQLTQEEMNQFSESSNGSQRKDSSVNYPQQGNGWNEQASAPTSSQAQNKEPLF